MAFAQETLNLIIVGQMKDDTQTAAVGLGNAIITLFGIAILLGLNSALNTFASQAYGAREIELCGVYYWRARFVLLGAYVIVSPVFIYSDQLLKILK